MRISDWSSDVCSSDLLQANLSLPYPSSIGHWASRWAGFARKSTGSSMISVVPRGVSSILASVVSPPSPRWTRSEEHTSELQSLMRISYAVFCLKKKKETKSISNAHSPNMTSQRPLSRHYYTYQNHHTN